MNQIKWNQQYEYNYDLNDLINISEYFSTMYNGKFIETIGKKTIDIQLPNNIIVSEVMFQNMNQILKNWYQLDLELIDTIPFEELIEIYNIFLYLQIKNIEYLTILIVDKIKITTINNNNIVSIWYILFTIEDYNYIDEIMIQYINTIEHLILITKSLLDNKFIDNLDTETRFIIFNKLYSFVSKYYPLALKTKDINDIFILSNNDLIELSPIELNVVEINNTIDTNNNYYYNTYHDNYNFKVKNQIEIKELWNQETDKFFQSIPIKNVIVSGNIIYNILGLIENQNRSLDFYIYSNNYKDIIGELLEYINLELKNTLYLYHNKVDNTINIFSDLISYHINIHYNQNWENPIEILNSFPFYHQQIYLENNELYYTSKSILSLLTSNTYLTKTITLDEYYYTYLLGFNINLSSLNYIETNYNILDSNNEIDITSIKNIPEIKLYPYLYFNPLKIYSIEKNKYELEIHYLLNSNQIYYQNIETFLEKIVVEIEDSKPYNENIILKPNTNLDYQMITIEIFNLLLDNYNSIKLSLNNVLINFIEESSTSNSNKYNINIILNKYQQSHNDVLHYFDYINLKTKHILTQDLNYQVLETEMSEKYQLQLNINNSAMIKNTQKQPIRIDKLIELTQLYKVTINLVFSVDYISYILQNIYLRSNVIELDILDFNHIF